MPGRSTSTNKSSEIAPLLDPDLAALWFNNAGRVFTAAFWGRPINLILQRLESEDHAGRID